MYSYSQIQTYKRCPRAYFCHYIAEMPEVSNIMLDSGSALHRIAERGTLRAGLEYLRRCSYIYNDAYEDEEIKLGEQGYKLLQWLDTIPQPHKHEVRISDDNYIGFIDLIADGNIYDYKYTASTKPRDGYQLSLYKYFSKLPINKLYYVIVPTTRIRQKKTETLAQFRRRIIQTLKEKKITLQEVQYDERYIEDFFQTIEKIKADKEWKQNTDGCRWCSYKGRCNMIKLPENKRQKRQNTNNIKLWIYGAPYVGKTTLANTSTDPIFLNTDGNIKYIDAPAIAIKDYIKKVQGSNVAQKKAGWEIFKEAVETLATDPQGFKTVVVDLVEGVYELCRAYMLDKNGWEHESDDSFKAWDIVRTEFLNTMRQLTNLNMNVVLLSHEDTSKDITRRDGSKNTTVKPNINDKVAKQLAGMVDLTARMVAVNDKRFISLKSDETQFGGGRIKTEKNNIEVKEENSWQTITALLKSDEGARK